MFHKLNFGTHFNTVKNFLGQGYHHGKRFLGHLDHAYRTGKDIYKMIEPSLQQIAPETTGKANMHLNRMDSNYSSIREKVSRAHSHVKDIAGKLKAQHIHIGL